MSEQANRKSSLVARVHQSLGKHVLLDDATPVVVGVSGGIDSVVLLHVLIELGVNAHVLHVNYHLRGVESDGDETFVRDLCANLGVPVEVYHAEPEWLANASTSVQDAARVMRYEHFERLARHVGANAVAVAHNQDDQTETILMHLARGTGISGFAGMPEHRPISNGSSVTLLRPLIRVERREIVEFASSRGIRWREDVSNSDDKYTRSRVRRELRPSFDAVFGDRGWANVAQSARRAAEGSRADDADLAQLMLDGVLASGSFAVRTLASVPAGVQHRIILECLRRWLPLAPRTESTILEIASLVDRPAGSEKVYRQSRVIRERDSLVFVEESPTVFKGGVLGIGESIDTPVGTIRLDELKEKPSRLKMKSSSVAYVDLGRVGRLFVRSWQAGDVCVPINGSGSRNVSDVLTDARIRVKSRSAWPVVVANSGEIVWVAGIRMMEPGRVTDRTSRCGLLQFYGS